MSVDDLFHFMGEITGDPLFLPFEQYFKAVFQANDIFSNYMTDEWIQEFKSLPKLKYILLTAYSKCEKQEGFMSVFEDTYFQEVGEDRDYLLYMKHYGSAFQIALKISADYACIDRKSTDFTLVEQGHRKPGNVRTKRHIQDKHKSEPAVKVVNHSEKGVNHSENVVHHSEKGVNHSENGVNHSENVVDYSEKVVHHSKKDVRNLPTTLDYHQQANVDNRRPRNRVEINENPVIFKVGARRSECFDEYVETSSYRAEEQSTRSLQLLRDFDMDCPCPNEDVKVAVDMPRGENMIVPYAAEPIPLTVPSYHSEWAGPDVKSHIVKTLKRFCRPVNAGLSEDDYWRDRKLSHLFIHDILLAPSNLSEDLKETASINLRYPTKYNVLFQAFQEIRKAKFNAYVIKSIYVAYGVDIAIRAIDPEVCLDEIKTFIGKLFKEIRLEFNNKSNLRTKDDMQVYRPPFPSVCFITIPYCTSKFPVIKNFNKTFKKINDYFKDLVEKQDSSVGDYMDLKLIDWQKLVETDDYEPIGDIAGRYQLLYKLLNQNETVFINPN